MSILTEDRMVHSISWRPTYSVFEVQWKIVIKKDGSILSETYHRKVYSVDQRDEFIAEVDNGISFITSVGW